MAVWDRLREELDHAGAIAQGAIDEGRTRLEAFRARQRADHAAQELGWAVYRARAQGEELDAGSYARLSSAIAAHEAEAGRLDGRLDANRRAAHRAGGRADESGRAGAEEQAASKKGAQPSAGAATNAKTPSSAGAPASAGTATGAAARAGDDTASASGAAGAEATPGTS